MQVINYGAEKRGNPLVTTLIGDLVDQAVVAGVLSTVYMLGLSLLSVTYLGQPESNNGHEDNH